MGNVIRAAGAIALVGVAVLVTGCAPPPPPLPYISPEAMAALPKGTDLRTVKRRADGCYFIQTSDDLSGYLTPVTGSDGKLVCDKV